MDSSVNDSQGYRVRMVAGLGVVLDIYAVLMDEFE